MPTAVAGAVSAVVEEAWECWFVAGTVGDEGNRRGACCWMQAVSRLAPHILWYGNSVCYEQLMLNHAPGAAASTCCAVVGKLLSCTP